MKGVTIIKVSTSTYRFLGPCATVQPLEGMLLDGGSIGSGGLQARALGLVVAFLEAVEARDVLNRGAGTGTSSGDEGGDGR